MMAVPRMVTMTVQVDTELYELALAAARDHKPPLAIQPWVALAMQEKIQRGAM